MSNEYIATGRDLTNVPPGLYTVSFCNNKDSSHNQEYIVIRGRNYTVWYSICNKHTYLYTDDEWMHELVSESERWRFKEIV